MIEVHSFGPDWARAFYAGWVKTKPMCSVCGRSLAGPGICQACAKAATEVQTVTLVQPCEPCQHLDVRLTEISPRSWKWRCMRCDHQFNKP